MKEKDKRSAAQNSSVRYEGIDNSTGQRRLYYGQVEEIWELDYGGKLRITVFRCQWVKPKAVAVDNYGLTTMDLQSISYKDDPWLVATDVVQVAYYIYPEDTKRHAGVGAQRLGAHSKRMGDRGDLLGWAVALCWCEAEEAGRGMTFGP
jgi:hypothetical protein